jgi:hypothetical protein
VSRCKSEDKRHDAPQHRRPRTHSRVRAVPEALKEQVEQERETEVQALGICRRILGISGRYRWLGEAAETEPRFGQAPPPPGITAGRDTSRSTVVSSVDETDFITVDNRRKRRRGEYCQRVRPFPLQETGVIHLRREWRPTEWVRHSE